MPHDGHHLSVKARRRRSLPYGRSWTRLPIASGDDAWQTVITGAGLLAVKAALRRNATKSIGCILPMDPIALAERASVDRGKSE